MIREVDGINTVYFNHEVLLGLFEFCKSSGIIYVAVIGEVVCLEFCLELLKVFLFDISWC